MLEEVSVASPDYLKQFGTPIHPDELTHHKTIEFQSSVRSKPLALEFTCDDGILSKLISPSLKVNSAETLVAAAQLGLGIIQVPRYHVEQDIKEGALITLCEAFPPPPSPVYLLYPRNREHVSRVRVFIEWLRDVFNQVNDPQ